MAVRVRYSRRRLLRGSVWISTDFTASRSGPALTVCPDFHRIDDLIRSDHYVRVLGRIPGRVGPRRHHIATGHKDRMSAHRYFRDRIRDRIARTGVEDDSTVIDFQETFMDATLKCTDTLEGQGTACKAGDTV